MPLPQVHFHGSAGRPIHAFDESHYCKASLLLITPVLINSKLTVDETEQTPPVADGCSSKCPLDLTQSPKLPDVVSPTSTLASSTPSLLNRVTGLVTPSTHAFDEPPNKKRRTEPPPSPSPITTTSSPGMIPLERAQKLQMISEFIEDNIGCCPFHGLSSSLDIINQHADLRHCDLIDTSKYKAVFRKAMRKSVNNSVLCFSCCGYMGFHHPVERTCDSEALQDIWIGIPYIVFCVPALHRIIFAVLGKHNYRLIIRDIESFVVWLFQPSPRNGIPTRATPNVFDLLIAFASCSNEFAEIEWSDALAEANARIANF
ncbi:uncharacterized protein F5891DRAFT_1202238 [Suillus fuscotomentosus]|uniref:Uncharacterized protein n=1 Tax=Suillus fuscotomentosus TaxID=1912939 RepID=A0AAD4HBP8_9AGAM|nr:uncharacterized protein F5891DRAFT_1202238 [Suillus fuscotomentosus]KAG1884842.1 hypothetical protein F5891DRAFT_1202238 [Suillus fuscotomentosus]